MSAETCNLVESFRHVINVSHYHWYFNNTYVNCHRWSDGTTIAVQTCLYAALTGNSLFGIMFDLVSLEHAADRFHAIYTRKVHDIYNFQLVTNTLT